MKKKLSIIICFVFVVHLTIMYFITGNGKYFDNTGNWFPYLEIRPFYQTIILASISILLLVPYLYKDRLGLGKKVKRLMFPFLFLISGFLFYLSGQYILLNDKGSFMVKFNLFTITERHISNFDKLKNRCFDFSNFHDSVWWGYWPCAQQSECIFKMLIVNDSNNSLFCTYRLSERETLTVFKGFWGWLELNHDTDSFKSLNSLNNK